MPEEEISAPAHQNLKNLYKGLNGVQSCTLSDGLNKAAFLNSALTVAAVGTMYIPRTGAGVRRLQLPKSSSWVNLRSCPLDDLLQQMLMLLLEERSEDSVFLIWGHTRAFVK